jgi:long-chain acyl-CoA synthetase
MGALTDPLCWTADALGEIPASIEVKLVDFPDAGYYASNNPPQGEIWIRGDSVADGYLELPKETEESFAKDGWFKTGDIGEWDKKGQLKIIDRKKNLVKTLNGEYIALEKVCLLVLRVCAISLTFESSRVCTVAPLLLPISAFMPTQ